MSKVSTVITCSLCCHLMTIPFNPVPTSSCQMFGLVMFAARLDMALPLIGMNIIILVRNPPVKAAFVSKLCLEDTQQHSNKNESSNHTQQFLVVKSPLSKIKTPTRVSAGTCFTNASRRIGFLYYYIGFLFAFFD